MGGVDTHGSCEQVFEQSLCSLATSPSSLLFWRLFLALFVNTVRRVNSREHGFHEVRLSIRNVLLGGCSWYSW